MTPDWDPKAEHVLRDQRAAYDNMRERCPVAYSELLGWSLFRHEDVLRVLRDAETYSSAVSSHLSVPSGMDAPEHTPYRRIVERYFVPERMDAFEPTCGEIAADLVQGLFDRGQVELMADFALPFAARTQCAFLGWPSTLAEALIRWTQKNHAATFAQDRKATSEIAREFECFVAELLDARLQAATEPDEDITTSLMQERVWGRSVSREEIASILRNWTVGEVGSLAAATGILVHYLAEHVDLQSQLRDHPSRVPAAIDEILRIDGPLLSGRRITTRPVEIQGRKIDAGERITLHWTAANRDGRVFADPDNFRLDRDPRMNLLYGAGVHACPGAPLARLQMRVCLEELLEQTEEMRLVTERPPTNAVYPASGLAVLPVYLRKRL
jgi:cytochrome P450